MLPSSHDLTDQICISYFCTKSPNDHFYQILFNFDHPFQSIFQFFCYGDKHGGHVFQQFIFVLAISKEGHPVN